MVFEEYFKGKSVLITGTGRGLGRALATRLDSYGARVYAVSRTLANLESLKKECPKIETIHLDIGDWNKTKEVISKLGPLDYVINNAGVQTVESFMEIKPETFDWMFNINVKSIINVSQVAAKNMIETGVKGSILNVSSISSSKPQANNSVYGLTKASVDFLTKLMAIELGPYGIRVNAVNPAGIDTDMLRSYFDVATKQTGRTKDDFSADWDKTVPNGRFQMQMDEAINASLFLLSNCSPMIHGTRLFVDGGLHMA